jgi:HPt (histidine-containing phosphotransfer) domain-containing protein
MNVLDQAHRLLKSSSAKGLQKIAWLRHSLQAKINTLLLNCPAGLSTLDDAMASLPVTTPSSKVTHNGDSDSDDTTDLDSDGGSEGFIDCEEEESGLEANIFPELVRLPLPSQVGIRICRDLGLSQMASQEVELRKGQAHECLHRLKLALGLKSALFRKTIRLAKSQKNKTRGWSTVRRVEASVRIHVRRYNGARRALLSLGCSQHELQVFQAIQKEDLKMNHDVTEENRFGQRSHSVAWFWRINGGQTNDTWQDESK